jgi:hypothetical protein
VLTQAATGTGTAPGARGGSARWVAAREAELLPAPYSHVVFTLPPAIGDIACQNKAVIYGLLFKGAQPALETAIRAKVSVIG